MSTELPKTFDPAEIEARWYTHWENEGLFRPERPDAERDPAPSAHGFAEEEHGAERDDDRRDAGVGDQNADERIDRHADKHRCQRDCSSQGWIVLPA
mgnify:CR=1 FL=1